MRRRRPGFGPAPALLLVVLVAGACKPRATSADCAKWQSHFEDVLKRQPTCPARLAERQDTIDTARRLCEGHVADGLTYDSKEAERFASSSAPQDWRDLESTKSFFYTYAVGGRLYVDGIPSMCGSGTRVIP